jgi:hypothetical protein
MRVEEVSFVHIPYALLLSGSFLSLPNQVGNASNLARNFGQLLL